jgi:hypothetical protein
LSRVSIGFGVGLIVLGVGAFLYALPTAGKTPFTALIPAVFGAALLLLGLLARKENLRKHVMHAAAAVGLVGFVIPAVMGFPKLPTLLSEGHVTRADGTDATTAVLVQVAMAVLCLAFVALCVNSFVQARRRRAAG